MCKSKLKVLLIDDDREFLNLYYIYSEKHNQDLKESPCIQVISLTNPKDVLKAVRYKRPDVIVCDLEMPQLSGIEVLHLLLSKRYKIPFILCSSRKHEELLNLSAEDRIDYFIEKSIPLELTFEGLTSLILKSYKGHILPQKSS